MEHFAPLPRLIGVIADTHVPKRARSLPPQVLQGLAGCDLILHAGDIQSPPVLDELAAIAPVRAVAGNNEPPDLAAQLGFARMLAFGAWRVGLVHGHIEPAPRVGYPRPRDTLGRALASFTGVDCVVFGHSHIPVCRTVEGVLAFNPGSPTDWRRNSPGPSYGLLRVTEQGLAAEIVYF